MIPAFENQKEGCQSVAVDALEDEKTLEDEKAHEDEETLEDEKPLGDEETLEDEKALGDEETLEDEKTGFLVAVVYQTHYVGSGVWIWKARRVIVAVEPKTPEDEKAGLAMFACLVYGKACW